MSQTSENEPFFLVSYYISLGFYFLSASGCPRESDERSEKKKKIEKKKA